MKISVRDPRLTKEERADKQESRAERKKLRASKNGMRKANFNALANNAQKFEALRESNAALLAVVMDLLAQIEQLKK